MKKYNKYYLKRNPADNSVLVDDGNPVLGDLAKADCPLEDWHIRALNKSWKNTGVFYALVEEKETKSDARIALEKEATELGIKFRDNIGDDKLQEKINKAIEE